MDVKLRKRLRNWAAGALVCAVIVLILVHLVILPSIVRQQFNGALRDAGIEGATFRVPTATASRARILDVRFPNSDTRVDAINVQYGVGGIRRGQLDALRVSGLHLVIGVDANGKLDLGPLEPLLKPKPRSATRATVPTTMRRTPVPIVRVELADSEAIIAGPLHKTTVPLIGTLVGAQSYRYLLDFEADLGAPVVLSGSLTPSTGEMRLNLSSDDADAEKLSQVIAAFAPGASLAVQGRLRTRSSLEWDGNFAQFTAQLEAKPTSEASAAADGDANVTVHRGVFELDAAVDAKGAGTARLSVRDAAFSQRGAGLEVQGVGGRLELTSLAPLTSPPNQRLRVERLKAGDIELTNGRVEFQVIDSQHIQVEHTQWNWLGGELLAQDFSLAQGELAIGVQMQKVDLAQLLKTFAQGKASGTGTVSGAVNFKMSGSSLVFGVGHLEAQQNGTLQIAEDVANQVAPPQGNATPQQQVGKNVAEALKSFQFIALTAKISPEDRGRLDAKIHGRGATGAHQEITYEPRVTGLNDLVGLVLHVRQAMSAGDNRSER